MERAFYLRYLLRLSSFHHCFGFQLYRELLLLLLLLLVVQNLIYEASYSMFAVYDSEVKELFVDLFCTFI